MKESRILSLALKYLHRLMAHALFPRKDGDSVVSTTKLTLLYYMCNNIKLDICHAIAIKLKDVATKSAGAIKVGGLITTITRYVGFDMENMPFQRLKGPSLIDLQMMQWDWLQRRDQMLSILFMLHHHQM